MSQDVNKVQGKEAMILAEAWPTLANKRKREVERCNILSASMSYFYAPVSLRIRAHHKRAGALDAWTQCCYHVRR